MTDDQERLALAYIRVRGAHNPTADELENDEEVRPCAWCRLAAEQHVDAALRAGVSPSTGEDRLREAARAYIDAVDADMNRPGTSFDALRRDETLAALRAALTPTGEAHRE